MLILLFCASLVTSSEKNLGLVISFGVICVCYCRRRSQLLLVHVVQRGELRRRTSNGNKS